MILKIQPNSSTADISEQFNQFFPFLKLEFFRNPHGESQPTGHKAMLKSPELISEISKNKNFGEFVLSPAMTVAEFEKRFQVELGLNVQVFRKSGKVWLETTITDNLTLQSQNALGLEKSFATEQPDPSDIDYD